MANLQVGVAGNGTVTVGAGASVHSPASNTLTLGTNGDERVRIDSSGTAKFSGNIEVDIGSSGMIDFGDITSGYGRLYADSTGTFIGSKSNDPLILRTNHTEVARLDTSGRLLLGTTTEGEASADNLTVADSGDCGITIRGGTSSNCSILFSDATSSTGEYAGNIDYDHNGDYMRIFTASAERLRIDSSGRVLIGTTTEGTPTYGEQLTIANSGTHCGMTIRSATSGVGALYFSDGTSGNSEYRSYFEYHHSDDSLRIAAAASERLRIASNGALGIGGANYGTSGQVLTSGGSGAAISWAAASGGKILQVVEATTTTQVSSTSKTMADSGLSGSITPSATSSKILVFVNQSFRQYRNRNSTNNMGFGANLLRGSTVVMESKRNDNNENNDFYLSNHNSNNVVLRHTMQVLDSPSTTSATTYKTQFACTTTDDSGQVWAQPSWESQNRAPTSSIILIEVGA